MSLNHYTDQPHQLKDIVQSAINRNGFVAFSRINAEVNDDNIILSGTVDTYYQKQMAQESVRQIAGTTSIENRILVSSGV